MSTKSTNETENAASGLQVESYPIAEQETILVLDFGSQTAQLIARRVREHQVYCLLVRHDISVERIREINPKGIILSGGPSSVYGAGAPQPDPGIFDLDVPMLGICYGMQVLCEANGSHVQSTTSREYGRSQCRFEGAVDLLKEIPEQLNVWMSHGDQVEEISGDFHSIAQTPTCRNAAVKHQSREIYGLQFHPEVSHTEYGSVLLQNFVKRVCQCAGTWKMSSFIDQQVENIRERVGQDRVICGLSGGVDSAVTAALLYKAIGPQLSCIFVDNGLLRQGEVEQVRYEFRHHFETDLHVVDAHFRFLSALKGVTDPQQKRKLIGKLFIDVFQHEASSIENAKFLAQGTLYPDVIESGADPDGPAATIKSHHNVGGLPEELGFELIEPLRDLFKDEVRKLGLELGLPEKLVWRHPFPGPGLSVRCLGEITPERLDTLRQADAIFLEELEKSGWSRRTQQAFAVLLPVKAVGVMGDGRTYQEVLALRAISTEDYMTADWTPLPIELLQTVSTRLTNEIAGINRVVYDISSKPPATIEWE